MSLLCGVAKVKFWDVYVGMGQRAFSPLFLLVVSVLKCKTSIWVRQDNKYGLKLQHLKQGQLHTTEYNKPYSSSWFPHPVYFCGLFQFIDAEKVTQV